jgi:YHS domain-containing protein
VIAFVFADLIVLPIVAIYVKYYGRAFALRIALLMFVTMVIGALVVDAMFGGLGLIPHVHPSRGRVFGSIGIDYKLFLNILGLAIFAGLLRISSRRSATDPVCGMKVDRAKGVRREQPGPDGTVFFCSEGCAERFERAAATRRPALPDGTAS